METIREFMFPQVCCNCNINPNTTYFILQDKDFNNTTTAITLPICESCDAEIKARTKKAQWAYAIVNIAVLVVLLLVSILVHQVMIFILGALILFFFWSPIYHAFTNPQRPARITQRYGLSFRNKEYQKRFDALNPKR